MSINLEVICETQSGDTLCLSGEDPALGAWSASEAVRFQTTESTHPVWTAEIAVPSGGGEFKFLIARRNDEVAWEPLEKSRSWPTTGLAPGAVLRTKFGEMKTSIEASTALLEAQARSYRDLENRRGSALQANVDRKGENAYYHAHSRDFQVPEDAKVITGPGLVTGGAPVLLECGTVTEEDPIMWLKEYSWADSDEKVKVYVPLAEGVLPLEGAESMVEAKYNATNLEITIMSKPKQRLRIEKLNAEIDPEACRTRVEAKKSRIVLQLAKKRKSTWYNLTKK